MAAAATKNSSFSSIRTPHLYLILQAVPDIKGWFYSKLEIVRTILVFRRLAQEQVTGAGDQVAGLGWQGKP
jgi:hypothetical protein